MCRREDVHAGGPSVMSSARLIMERGAGKGRDRPGEDAGEVLQAALFGGTAAYKNASAIASTLVHHCVCHEVRTTINVCVQRIPILAAVLLGIQQGGVVKGRHLPFCSSALRFDIVCPEQSENGATQASAARPATLWLVVRPCARFGTRGVGFPRHHAWQR